ncbi:hypothetical protein [Alkalihalobacterium elongatum]|uniref:hypothetical protein n=1 Tax=Alkalihalobacterium elongatum TaxID=2675466 RepID=UPI001C1F9CEE|nr:hypothetical protein [Alkalihalobacterium elongatum]
MSQPNPLLPILLEAYEKGEKDGIELKDLMKDIEQHLRTLVDSKGNKKEATRSPMGGFVAFFVLINMRM